MKGCYSDSCILYSEFFNALFRGLRFKPDAEIGPSMLLRVMSLSNEPFGIFEMYSIRSHLLRNPEPRSGFIISIRTHSRCPAERHFQHKRLFRQERHFQLERRKYDGVSQCLESFDPHIQEPDQEPLACFPLLGPYPYGPHLCLPRSLTNGGLSHPHGNDLEDPW